MKNPEQNLKPWSPFHLGLISYFCIILPGGLLFAENYKRLGLPGRKRLFQLISLSWFAFFILTIAFLPSELYWVSELIHLIFPLGMILLQNPHYQRWREETEDMVPTASLQKPVVLSVLFALLLFAGIAAKDWYLQYKLEQEMGLAQEAFLGGRFEASATILQKLEREYPDERTVYINLALSQDAAGKRDSAILCLSRWLQRAPEDKEASDLLYNLRYGLGSE